MVMATVLIVNCKTGKEEYQQKDIQLIPYTPPVIRNTAEEIDKLKADLIKAIPSLNNQI